MTVDPVDVADGDRGEVNLRTRVSRVPKDVRMSALTSGWWLMSVVVVTG